MTRPSKAAADAMPDVRAVKAWPIEDVIATYEHTKAVLAQRDEQETTARKVFHAWRQLAVDRLGHAARDQVVVHDGNAYFLDDKGDIVKRPLYSPKTTAQTD